MGSSRVGDVGDVNVLTRSAKGRLGGHHSGENPKVGMPTSAKARASVKPWMTHGRQLAPGCAALMTSSHSPKMTLPRCSFSTGAPSWIGSISYSLDPAERGHTIGLQAQIGT